MRPITKTRFNQIVTQFSSSGDILVVGDLGIDKYTYGNVDRISPEAPVPILSVTKEWKKLGLAANISHNLKTLDVGSLIIGIIGDDDNAKEMEQLLNENNLSTKGLVKDRSRPTIFKERITTSTQQICRIDYENSSQVSPEISGKIKKIFDQKNEKFKAVILEDYSKGALNHKLIQHMIQFSKEKKILVCIDPGKSTNPKAYLGADLLKPNFLEAKQMVKDLGYSFANFELAEVGNLLKKELKIARLVITLGKDGMALWDHDKEMVSIPTLADEVYDVSGAGDTSISLLTICLLAGATLEEAAWISNCGAGVVVAKKGTATVDRKELTDFFNKMILKLDE